MNFNIQDSSALYGLIADSQSDIILKLDPNGRLIHASAGIERLGVSMSSAPHFLELVGAGREGVAHDLDAAIAGSPSENWVELAVTDAEGRDAWFEFRATPLCAADGRVEAVLALMRSIDDKRDLSDRLFAATYTDPLTGVTNRGAFVSMLGHMIGAKIEGCMAMFGIDFFRAINMKHGQDVGDDVLRTFANLLREALRESDVISRVGADRFAVLLPRTSAQEAEAVCSRVVTSLADLRHDVGCDRIAITVSGSIARVAISVESTIERAELALFSAKAKGRNRLEMEKPRRILAA